MHFSTEFLPDKSAKKAKDCRTLRGFTLIELVISVAVIAALAAVAVPNYKRFISKVRQAEAKSALATVYAMEKSFYGEYNAYIPAWDAIGYFPDGNIRYYSIEACWLTFAPWSTGTVTGYTGPAAVIAYGPLNSPFPIDYIATPGACPTKTCTTILNDPQNFISSAIGQLNQGTTTDMWTINENKQIQNCVKGQ